MSPPPLLGQNLSTPGSSSTAVPLGDFGPKPFGYIYILHPGCHTFGNTRLRLPGIGFFITETPSTGVSSVASRTRVPRRTTFPFLCGCAGCGSRYLLPHISSVAALYAASHMLLILVAVTRVPLYSVIRQLPLPRAVVSCMTFLSVAVRVPTGTYTLLLWAIPP